MDKSRYDTIVLKLKGKPGEWNTGNYISDCQKYECKLRKNPRNKLRMDLKSNGENTTTLIEIGNHELHMGTTQEYTLCNEVKDPDNIKTSNRSKWIHVTKYVAILSVESKVVSMVLIITDAYKPLHK